MERIQLTRNEKIVLRFAALGGTQPDSMSLADYTFALVNLQSKGLVDIDYDKETPVCELKCELSGCGRVYLAENPTLRNPINWVAISAIGSIFALIISLIALFVACAKC